MNSFSFLRGWMHPWITKKSDLVIRYLDRVVVKDDGYEVAFKAGVTVEVEV